MSRAYKFSLLLTGLFTLAGLAQERRYLRGELVKDDNSPVPYVEVRILGSGSGITTSSGEFRIELPPELKTGVEVRLRVMMGGWVIKEPYDSRLIIPENLRATVIKVVIVPKGSPTLLSHETLSVYIRNIREAAISPTGEIQDDQYELEIAKKADELGFTKEKLWAEINAWLESERLPFLRGMAALEKQDFSMAADLISKSIEVELTSLAEKYFQLGIAEQFRERYESALTAYRETIRFDPQFIQAYIKVGTLLKEQEKLEDARIEFEKILELNPDEASAHYNLADVLSKLGQIEEAILHFQKVVELDSNSTEAHFGWGKLVLRQEKYDEAFSHFQRALAIDSTFVDVHLDWGRALAFQGKFDEAIFHYQKAFGAGQKRYHLAEKNDTTPNTQPLRRQYQSYNSF
jgi:tetratricopeptide (TPR) repeat protein